MVVYIFYGRVVVIEDQGVRFLCITYFIFRFLPFYQGY